jgi:RHS repeat-associated protein
METSTMVSTPRREMPSTDEEPQTSPSADGYVCATRLSRLTQVTDPSGAYSFTYDNLGRLLGTGTQYSFLSGTLSNSYAYDAASNRVSFSNPQSQITNYSYDSLNRLTGLNDSNTGNFGFGYDALGRRTSLTRPNGVGTSYSYDTLSRLLSVLHNGGSLPGSAGYTYDAAGNRLTKTAVQEASPNPLSVLSQYSYDPIYELTQAVVNGSVAESYSYDAVGNRLTSQGPLSYNYNASNQLTSTSAATNAYDNNGNTTSKTDSTGTTYYTWDFENRLTSVTLPGTGGTVNFKYDPFGRRIEKASSAGTTIYAYDGANVIEELGGGGNLLAHFTQGVGIDEPLATTGGGGTYFYHADGLGSITSLTDGSGQLAASYIYDSFGKLAASTGTITNPFQYTGREFDSETGLYNYRARHYDPQIGRFISEDGFRFQAGVNFYPYTSENPVNFIDPSGYKACSVDVRCWPIEKFHLGAIGFTHCFLTVVDKDSTCHDISGGPDHGMLLEWDSPSKPQPTAVTYNHSAVPCTMVDCIILTVPKINSLRLPYKSASQNSNSAFASILSACGLADLIQYAPSGAWGVSNHLLPSYGTGTGAGGGW